VTFDPNLVQPENVRASFAEDPEVSPAELRARLAALVRADSQRGRPTPEQAVLEAVAPLDRDGLRELLEGLAADAACADVKAIVVPSGRFYLFSEPTLDRNAAAGRCFREEAKLAIVERIRRDSRSTALTSMGDLDPLFPSPEPADRAELLAELRADERFRDVQALAAADGETWFHSDAHLSGNYGKIMMRAKAADPALAIAELVRDRSRTMPAPTKVTLFQERVFELSPDQIEAFLEGLGRPDAVPDYADIKKLVHPTTGAVYLYSDRWLLEAAALRVMDWDEVGASQNP
jgi:hypothetical protein